MFFLFPFLALISVLYFVLYLIHLFIQTPAETINPLTILIPLTTLGIIFFNAYFQNGNEETAVPIWLKISLRVYRVILLILVLMMTYKLFQTNSLDSNILICLITGILYSVTYAVTACFSESKERKWIQMGNIGCALFFIILLFLFNLPYMPISFEVGSHPPLITSMNHLNQVPS
jgi:FtsH-binding integral membrane protein